MARHDLNGPSKQLAFRLPESLIADVERVGAELAAVGLNLPRAEVVRLLLTRAIEATADDPQKLLKPAKGAKRRR